MTSDITLAAANIGAWSQYVGDLPKPLQDSIDIFTAVAQTESPLLPPDVSKATVAGLQKAVEGYSLALAAHNAFQDSRAAYRMATARNVLKVAGVYAEKIRDQHQANFDLAVIQLKDAIAALPDDTSAESILAHGASALRSWESAKAAVATLRTYAAWIGALTSLPVNAGLTNDIHQLLIVAPVNKTAYIEYVNLSDAGELPENWIYAAQNPGRYSFKFDLPYDIAARIQMLNAEVTEMRNPTMISFR